MLLGPNVDWLRTSRKIKLGFRDLLRKLLKILFIVKVSGVADNMGLRVRSLRSIGKAPSYDRNCLTARVQRLQFEVRAIRACQLTLRHRRFQLFTQGGQELWWVCSHVVTACQQQDTWVHHTSGSSKCLPDTGLLGTLAAMLDSKWQSRDN